MAIPSTKFGAWTVLSTDGNGKRATCLCACGTVRLIAIEALADGTSTSCGCLALSPEHVASLRIEMTQLRRRRDRDWRPQR